MTQIDFEAAASLLLDESKVCDDRPLLISDEGGLFMEMKHRRRYSKNENEVFDKYFSSGSRKVSHTRACCFLAALNAVLHALRRLPLACSCPRA